MRFKKEDRNGREEQTDEQGGQWRFEAVPARDVAEEDGDKRNREAEERCGVFREDDGNRRVLRVHQRLDNRATRAEVLELGRGDAEGESLEDERDAEHDVAGDGRLLRVRHADVSFELNQRLHAFGEREETADEEDEDADHERPEVALDRVPERVEQRRRLRRATQPTSRSTWFAVSATLVDGLGERREATRQERGDELRHRDEAVAGERRQHDADVVSLGMGHGSGPIAVSVSAAAAQAGVRAR